MNSRTLTRRLAAASAVTLVAGILTATPADAAEVEVIASGLNNPRQLAFAPGGTLYVAEAGVRGDSENCSEHPLGVFCLEFTGSVARVGRDGHVRRVVSGLPSISSPTETIGPFDLAFTGNTRSFDDRTRRIPDFRRASLTTTKPCWAPSSPVTCTDIGAW